MYFLPFLPSEILILIVASLSNEHAALARLCLVSRKFWDLAAPFLYRKVRFRGLTEDEVVNLRQLKCLASIATNPKLGSFVRIIDNFDPYSIGATYDGTDRSDTDTIVNAALNMRSLHSITVRDGALGYHIQSSLGLYLQLKILNAYNLDPHSFVWPRTLSDLTRLTWALPTNYGRDESTRALSATYFLLNVIRATCPLLESLIITCGAYGNFYYGNIYSSKLPNGRTFDQLSIFPDNRGLLQRLQKFGINFAEGLDPKSILPQPIKLFVKDHGSTLTSLLIPIAPNRSQEQLCGILSLCESLPQLKTLVMREPFWKRENEIEMDKEFLPGLSTGLANPKSRIESFTFLGLASPFNSLTGKAFASWTGLKSLHLGDAHNRNGPYDKNGGLDFESYKSEIQLFINELPQSLEQLYLTILGTGLLNDSEFFHVYGLGIPTLLQLRRLHSFDIIAWISKPGILIGPIPQRAVHFRRLPYSKDGLQSDQGSEYKPKNTNKNKVKEIWTSKRRCVNEKYSDLTHDSVVISLGELEGGFEGVDAGGIWWDGDEAACQRRNNWTCANDQYRSQHGKSRPGLDRWPAHPDNFSTYLPYARR